MPREGATCLHRELREEGIPGPWRPRRKIPNPWADIITPNTVPIVKVGKDGHGWANSRDIAAFFGKRHDHVLRDVDALISQDPSCAPNFGETSEVVAMPRGGTRKERAFLIDRDGFTLLAMGFTGMKAITFKRAYIKAYNTLEAQALADIRREMEAQRIADALAIAKAAGLYGPDTKAPLREVLARLIDVRADILGNL